MRDDEPVRTGVLGVGSMGRNHARVYHELPEADLCGVVDADPERAASVAAEFDTEALSTHELLSRADAVSVAIPTEYHYDAVRECIDAGVDLLVEKPLVADPDRGRTLVDLADRRGVTLQVGHVERFNPATRKLLELAGELDIVGVDVRRLGPPLDRDIDDSVVMDLMIHDVDILTALVDDPAADVSAVGNEDATYAAANVEFASGVVGQLTASRKTQEKERRLTITAENCRVKTDFIDQTLEIHRQSVPEFVEENGDVHYHHENVVERLSVSSAEPLRRELASFVDVVETGAEPVVTGEDGLRALELTREIESLATDDATQRTPTATH